MPLQLITTYLVLVNAAAFLLMHEDKHRARKGVWRIPEATLMGLAAAGGSIGAIAGMYIFRHKTRHPKFVLGLPAIVIGQIALYFLLRL